MYTKKKYLLAIALTGVIFYWKHDIPCEPKKSPFSGSYLIIPESSNILIFGKGNRYSLLNRGKLLDREMMNSLRKLSSGLKIASPSDDPAGFAIAENLKKIILEIRQRSINKEDLSNYLHYAESAVKQDMELLHRIRQLVLRASSGILSRDDREIVQSEINELIDEIAGNAQFSQFNTKKVIPDLTPEKLGIKGLDVVKHSGDTMGRIDRAMDQLIRLRSILGTKAVLTEIQIRGENLYYVNLQASESSIRDLDMAREISELIKKKTMLKSHYGIILYGR